jgi:hypothetical protein
LAGFLELDPERRIDFAVADVVVVVGDEVVMRFSTD